LFRFAARETNEKVKELPQPSVVAGLLEHQHNGDSHLKMENLSSFENGGASVECVANSYLRLIAFPTFPLDRLTRYEHILWRQARQIIFTLEALRRRKPVPHRAPFPFTFGASSR
jgi:hypothetical protein